MGSRRTGSVVVAHGLSCSAACGIFPDRGSNLCPLHWQADSQPLRHQGSPPFRVLIEHLPLIGDKVRERRVFLSKWENEATPGLRSICATSMCKDC